MLGKGLFFFGEHMDFQELTRRISPKLKAIAKKLDGRYTSFDEDDLYQEALLSLWRKHQNGQLDDKTDSFILQGCFFFLKNYIRKIYKTIDAKSVSLYSFIHEEEQTLGDILPAPDSEQYFKDTEAKILLENIYCKLFDRERKILELLIDNIPTRNIGRKFGISHVMVIKIKNKIQNKCARIEKEIK